MVFAEKKVFNNQEFVSFEDYKALWEHQQKQAQETAILKDEIAQMKRLIFGVKSERYIPTDNAQMSLELEGGVTQQEQEQQTEQVSYQRKKNKKQPKRQVLPAHLPRVEEIIEPKGDNSARKRIGEAVTEILEYKPSKIYVRKIVRPKYVEAATSSLAEPTLHIANLPTNLPLAKSNAGAGLLAYILVAKFVDHLPFYRIVKMLKREKIYFSESTINGWFQNCSKLLEPLYEWMKAELLNANYLQADETSIPVLSKNKPGATHTGYYWVYRNPRNKMVVFDYQPGRGKEMPMTVLKDYQGILQTDAYGSYDQFEKKGLKMLACMAHVRRKFFDAQKNRKVESQQALTMIGQLYNIERECRDRELSFEKIKKLRQEKAKPVLDEFYEWLLKQASEDLLPNSSIGKAVNYALRVWPRLVRYIEEGTFEIDNNLIENTIRPVAIGRKNYMFAGSHNGAKYAAMMYSFFNTCNAYGVNPQEWLKTTLENINETKINEIHKLLPGQ